MNMLIEVIFRDKSYQDRLIFFYISQQTLTWFNELAMSVYMSKNHILCIAYNSSAMKESEN